MKESFQEYKRFKRGDWISTKNGIHGKLRYVKEYNDKENIFVLLVKGDFCICVPESMIQGIEDID